MRIIEKAKNITLVGLGPMGTSIAKAFLGGGYEVTIWNRTASKTVDLVKLGAKGTQTIQEAVTANSLILLSLTDYNAMFQVLNPVKDKLKKRVLVNLSSDTPEKARKAARWAVDNGAIFLAGGIMADPLMIGRIEAYVFYSGENAIYNKYKPFLDVLGKGIYLGTDPGLALLYYQAQLNILFTSAAGIMQALALIHSANLSAKEFEPYLNETLNTLPYFFQTTVAEVDKGRYDGTMNNMVMMAAGMDHISQASLDAGIDTRLPNAVREIFKQTVTAGFGKNGLNSIMEVLKKPKIK